MSMRAAEALNRLQETLPTTGLTPAIGMQVMTEFYVDHRASDVNVAADGDMLLYQWGTYDWGPGENFELDITRQFVTGDGADDQDIWHLSLTFLFPPTQALRALSSGSRWCRAPDHVKAFTAFVTSTEAFRSVASRIDGSVRLEYECAG